MDARTQKQAINFFSESFNEIASNIFRSHIVDEVANSKLQFFMSKIAELGIDVSNTLSKNLPDDRFFMLMDKHEKKTFYFQCDETSVPQRIITFEDYEMPDPENNRTVMGYNQY